MNKEYFDHMISLGQDCSVSGSLRTLGYKQNAFPFDWNVTFLSFVKNAFNKKLENFLDFKYVKSGNGHMKNPESTIYFYHDTEYDELMNNPKKKEEFEKKFLRRTNRMISLLSKPSKILFIIKNKKDTIKDVIELRDIIKTTFPMIQFKILLINNIDEHEKADNIYHVKIDMAGFLKEHVEFEDAFQHSNQQYAYYIVKKIIDDNFISGKYPQPQNRDGEHR